MDKGHHAIGHPEKHGRIRSMFPVLSGTMNGKPLVFLDSAASSQKPVQVIEAMNHYYRHQHANIHRGVYQLSQQATDAFEEVRKKTAAWLNAEHAHEIIFTRGTTESINLVASSFGRQNFKPGDEILLTTLEHHSNIVPWQLIGEQTGAKLRVIPMLENGETDLEAYSRMLTDRVKMVALVHVSNALGIIHPVKDMIAMAHSRHIPVLIDGAQASPHFKPDVRDLDADFYALSAHKMYGPTGVGVLYGKTGRLEAMPPYQGGGEMISHVSFEGTTFNELPFKFEAGTPNIAGVIGFGAAIDFLHEAGYEYIASHENELLRYTTERLQKIDGIKIYGTSPVKASVISFCAEGIHPYDIGALLDKQGIAVRTGHHCTQPLMQHLGIPGTVRASLGIYNNRDDADRLLESLERALKMLR